MEKLCICFDLGNSSLKIGFALMLQNGVRYGKITEESPLFPSYYPSSAFFDEAAQEWVFGAEIDKRRSNSFSTIVKIKDMLSLLLPTGTETVDEENRSYYYNGNQFPKFLFPPIPELKDKGKNLGYLIRNGYSFTSPDTPQALCEMYFSHVAEIVRSGVERISWKFARTLNDYTVSLIYPNNASTAYINEFTRLVEKAFHKKVDRAVSSTRALVYYAESQNKVKDGDEFLVFDIGDESISVSKASLVNGEVLIDGVDGHELPLPVGGNDIDEKIVRLIESKIERRETIGVPSFGEEGHITESGLIEKNYLLTKNVKDAKVILSCKDKALKSIKEVPIDINREVFYRVNLSRDELQLCSGTHPSSPNTGVASRIAEYIVKETSKVINRRVNAIFLLGGVVETAGLFEYLQSYVSQKCYLPKEAVRTFESGTTESDSLGISETEDSSYAAALGGCVLSLFNIPVRICLPLTFATNYTTGKDHKEWYARTFAGKGTPLVPGKINEFTLDGLCAGSCVEEIYSLQVTTDEIAQRNIEGAFYSDDGLLIYSENNPEYKYTAEKYAGLKVILKNRIILTVHGKLIKVFEPNDRKKMFCFREGIRVDENGHAEIFIEPRNMPYRKADVLLMSGGMLSVDVDDIEIKFDRDEVGFNTNTGR